MSTKHESENGGGVGSSVGLGGVPWRCCDDELPSMGVWVLCWMREGRAWMCKRITDRGDEIGWMWSTAGYGLLPEIVTHWALIDAPPPPNDPNSAAA